ncbi:MAG TPA: 16S rRNA methyltransferase, partial [Alcanivorax sp.]|nr:16S rRNA methyltransferase [Alcanivorax sp.]
MAGSVAVTSPQAARDGGQTLVLGPVGDHAALSLWDPADRATPLSVDFLAGRQGYRLAADRARHERLVKALGRCRDGVQGVLDLT